MQCHERISAKFLGELQAVVKKPADATLLVRRSKTDGEGKGEIVWVGADSVRLVRTWLDRGGIAEGLLFRSVGKGGRAGTGLPPGQVPRIFKAMACKAGLPETVVEGLSGHSARVGAAQDMIAAGIALPAILQAGRWKSTAMVKIPNSGSLLENRKRRSENEPCPLRHRKNSIFLGQ